MSIQAVIFDLDGVIISTDELHYRGWKALADRENIEFNRGINNRIRGVSRRDSLEVILERADRQYTEEEKDEMCAYKNSIYVGLLDSLTRDDILDDADRVVKELRERGILTAIGSSSRNARKILDKIGMNDSFDAVADGNDITKSKPDPEIFLAAAGKLGVKPEKCAVVEDAAAGIMAAKAAGMTACAVGDAVSSDLADYRMESLKDLFRIISEDNGEGV